MALDPKYRSVFLNRSLRNDLHRQFVLASAPACAAESRYRAEQALRIARQADRCPEFHHGLVECPRLRAIQQFVSDLSEMLSPCARCNVGRVIAHPAQHAK